MAQSNMNVSEAALGANEDMGQLGTMLSFADKITGISENPIVKQIMKVSSVFTTVAALMQDVAVYLVGVLVCDMLLVFFYNLE
jgi:hypothetical protein